MSPTSRSFLNIVLLWLGLSCTLAIAEDRPMTGKKATAYAAIDKTVLQFMDTIGCQAATVAISIDGKLVYSAVMAGSTKPRRSLSRPMP